MKIRQGFVSNSSSTSFTCEICGATKSGWDSQGIEDFGFAQCPNDHIICLGEVIEAADKETEGFYALSPEEKRAHLIEAAYHDHVKDEVRAASDDELDEIYEEGFSDGATIKTSQCPICQFKEMSNDDVARYLEKEHKISRDSVFQEIKKFNKRRKKLHNDEYVSYVLQKINVTDDQCIEEIKNKFGIYTKFLKYIKT